jgi:SAM-dependent methyltransferase
MLSPNEPPIALDAYEQLAERYAAQIDTKPHNAYYERPALRALLPNVQGRRVFEAGCGTGVHIPWLLEHGAEVVGLDVSPAMLSAARRRLGPHATLIQADLGQPLDFLTGESFDLVMSSLVMHYLKDWSVPLRSFYRVLRPAGRLVFSTGHPMLEFLESGDSHYFEIEPKGMYWRGFGGEPVYMPFYRRPLSAITESLADAGFVIERLVEPLPTEEFRRADPENYERLMAQPAFVCLRARKE